MDVEFMKALQDKVNVVPLIAKADCLTPTEMRKLKDRVKHSTRNNPSGTRSYLILQKVTEDALVNCPRVCCPLR